MNILVNGTNLHGLLAESIANSFETSLFWSQLEYLVKVSLDNKFSFETSLECQIFHPIINELVELGDRVKLLDIMVVDFSFYTKGDNLELNQLIEAMEYSFISLFINLEYKYPLIFSNYGRKFFKENYSWVVRSVHEMIVTPDITNTIAENTFKFIMIQNITAMYNQILSKHHTIYMLAPPRKEVKKEINSGIIRRKKLNKKPNVLSFFQVSSIEKSLEDLCLDFCNQL